MITKADVRKLDDLATNIVNQTIILSEVSPADPSFQVIADSYDEALFIYQEFFTELMNRKAPVVNDVQITSDGL